MLKSHGKLVVQSLSIFLRPSSKPRLVFQKESSYQKKGIRTLLQNSTVGTCQGSKPHPHVPCQGSSDVLLHMTQVGEQLVNSLDLVQGFLLLWASLKIAALRPLSNELE